MGRAKVQQGEELTRGCTVYIAVGELYPEVWRTDPRGGGFGQSNDEIQLESPKPIVSSLVEQSDDASKV